MKFSIITPSYNQGRFVARTLQSVANQRGAEIEHLVFDGGSTDETIDILRSAGPNLRWVSEPDRGQAHAVNKGFLASDGEIIGWLNSDDIYYPDTVAQVASFFEAHPNIDAVYGKAHHIDVNDRIIDFYRTEPWSFDRLSHWCFICQPALFFRRSVIERFGLLDESLRYCMDYEYWLRIGGAGARFAYLPEALAGSRLHPATKTLGEAIQAHTEICIMLKEKIGTVPNRWILGYANVCVEQRCSRDRHPRWFAVQRGGIALWAAHRWNRRINLPLLQNVLRKIVRAHKAR